MIHLPNGHSFDFAVAAGALGFTGDGYLWEQPLRWLGLIDPSQFTIITKSLTFYPRRGNLRWYAPWWCVRLIPGGVVNAVGLTNPGIDWWLERCLPHVTWRGYKVIVSITPQTHVQASLMSKKIQGVINATGSTAIVGIEVNASCPNVAHDATVKHISDMVHSIQGRTDLPVLVKLGWQDPYLDICKELDGQVAAFDLINAVSWSKVNQGKPSPLAKYLLEGGVSGEPIKNCAEWALAKVKAARVKTPILSGGGVMNYETIRWRFAMGADAVAIGSLFLRRPLAPRRLVNQWRSENAR